MSLKYKIILIELIVAIIGMSTVAYMLVTMEQKTPEQQWCEQCGGTYLILRVGDNELHMCRFNDTMCEARLLYEQRQCCCECLDD